VAIKVGRIKNLRNEFKTYERLWDARERKNELKTQPRHYVKLLQLDESFGHRRLDDEPGAEAALIMERLGKDLGRLFEEADGKFSTKTTLMISIQLLECLEQLHAAGILHCDLKPENFLVGRASSGRDTRIFVVDFGQAKEYWKPLLAGGGGGGVHHVTPMPSGGAGVHHKSPQPPGRGAGGGGAKGSREEETDYQHIENDNKRHGVRGTIRYVSINAHKGKAVSRRDEIESLSYVLIYFLHGGWLPWRGLVKKKHGQQGNEKSHSEMASLRVIENCYKLRNAWRSKSGRITNDLNVIFFWKWRVAVGRLIWPSIGRQ